MRILFTGGGTAGHVYPALGVWYALRQRVPALAARWVGSERVESRLVPEAGMDFQHIDIRFSYRRLTPDNWGYYNRYILPLIFGKPFRQALAALETFRPDLVLASGGYVSAPVLWAAVRRNVPIALLQLDLIPGNVNWYFAPEAARVYCSNEQVAEAFSGRTAAYKMRVCGYPVLPAKRGRARVLHDLHLQADSRVLLAMGGSLGSGAVHHAVNSLLLALRDEEDRHLRRLAIVNVGGERSKLMHEIVDSELAESLRIQYRPVEYIEDGISAMLASDFYMGRCGASTTGELIAAGIPALLLPDPQHADRQQFANAELLKLRGQGSIVSPARLNGEVILNWLRKNWDRQPISAPRTPAALLIAEDIEELLSA